MDQPFPELEVNFCNAILSKQKISHLICMDKEDIVQEIIMSLMEDKVEWDKIRAKSTSTTLIYTALKNKISNFIDKSMTASDLARHSYREVGDEVYNQIRDRDGNAWQTYLNLPEPERSFIEDFYNPTKTIDRTALKHKHKITETQAARASRKVLRSARMDLTHRTLLSINHEQIDV